MVNKRAFKKVIVYLSYALIVLIMLFPIFWTFITSIRIPADIFKFPPTLLPQKITLANYFHVFTKTLIPRQFLNSLFVSLGTILVTITMSSLSGYGFARGRFRGKTSLLFAILVTHMVTGLSNIIALYTLAYKLKLLDSLVFLAFVYSALVVPFGVWFMKGFFEGIPSELEEAALVDGCSRFQAFYKIVLPLARPGLIAVAVFSFVMSWNEFLIALILISAEASKTLPLGIYTFVSYYGLEWGYITATAIVGVVPITVLFLALQKYFVTGLVKGRGTIG